MVVQQIRDAGRAEQVHLDGTVERRIERDARGRVDDDIARGERGSIRVVQSESIGSDVAGHHRQTSCHRGVEVGSEFGAQTIEGVVLQDLLAHSIDGRRATAVANQQHHRAVGDGTQQSLDQSGTDEAGGPGDGDAPSGKTFGDHGAICSTPLYQMVEKPEER